MAQGVLSFKYEEEKRETGMTGLAGLPVYLDLASVMGISASIARHIHVKHQPIFNTGTPFSVDIRQFKGNKSNKIKGRLPESANVVP